MAWVDILTHQEALRTPAVKISGPEKKDFEVRTCTCVCLARAERNMVVTICLSYLSQIMFCFATTLSIFVDVYLPFS
jgi:hypothetical protein